MWITMKMTMNEHQRLILAVAGILVLATVPVLSFAPTTYSIQVKQTPGTQLGVRDNRPGEANDDAVKTDALICGGGPAGLLAAIMLAQKYPNRKVSVFDRLSEPPSPTDDTVWGDISKFYLIGLGGRGQTSLDKFGVWKDVEDACTAVVGRKDWTPQTEQPSEVIFTDRKFTTQVLPRDKLVSVLYKHIVDNYSEQVEMRYGYEVRPVDFGESEGSSSATVEVFKCNGETKDELDCDSASLQTISTELLIAAEGTARTIANEIAAADLHRRESMSDEEKLLAGKPFEVYRYEDDNQRVYKTIPFKLPDGWRPDLNYSVRTKGDRIILDVLPANSRAEYCGTLLMRKDDDLAQANTDPALLRTELDSLVPMFSEILDDKVVAQVAQKAPSLLPSFRYAGPRLNQGDYTVILGDCAHTVKPYFGLGANSALEDVKILSDCLDSTSSVPEAVQEYTARRAMDSQVLVRLSRELDRPGTLGIFTFLIPIIMDAIFSKAAPQIFSPNTISMLQRDDITFQEVALKKRTDRFLQILILASFFAGVAHSINLLVSTVSSSS